MQDVILHRFIENEDARQRSNIELIASENFISKRVSETLASSLSNKYAEGYPEQSSIDLFKLDFPDYTHTGNIGRYYGGCQNVDMVELYCRYMWQKVFKVDKQDNLYHVNVQPHSGSQANMAVYQALLNPGDTILAMDLNNGGHLTHGSKASFSGKLYNSIFYNVTDDGYIDSTDLISKIINNKPKLIIAGASAYPRAIHFQLIKSLIDYAACKTNDSEYHPYFMVDMSHIAGLIACDMHDTPFGVADVVTTTTHKTLRGPRGALIFCKPELAEMIDSAVFPGTQGGPLMHVIAAKAVAAEEALTPEYKRYIEHVLINSRVMCEKFKELGYKIVTDGTDNHMFLIDLSPLNLTGKEVQELLDTHNITVNKNCIPNDKLSPKLTSGIRIGTPAITTSGFTERTVASLACLIDNIIKEYMNNKLEGYINK